MTKFSKAALALKLKDYGFVLAARHWKDLDRLLKATGFVTREAVIVQAAQWGWSEPMLDQLKGALKP